MPKASNIAIIGAGTYGSYLANCLSEALPESEIHLYDVGDDAIRSEEEIGYRSTVKGGMYKAATDGRFFGFGGTSAKWGGQLLFFSVNDFADGAGMGEVIECNLRYREKVLGRFFSSTPALVESDLGDGLFLKQGIWLKFAHRNIFKHFKIAGRQNVTLHPGSRAVRVDREGDEVRSITVSDGKGVETDVTADVYYLTSGAFESLRLLHASGMVEAPVATRGFSDHVSVRSFEFTDRDTSIGELDLGFKIVNGSMVTSRIVGDSDHVGFYVHPIFNEDLVLFQFLKNLLFKGKFSSEGALTAISQIAPMFRFAWEGLVRRRLFVYGRWFLHINVELARSENNVEISDETDKFGQTGIRINYEVSKETADKVVEIKKKIKQLLVSSGVAFREIDDADIAPTALEDVYHPYALFQYLDSETIFDVYKPANNLYMFNTGLLRRAGGLNPTASLFCLIEQHVEECRA